MRLVPVPQSKTLAAVANGTVTVGTTRLTDLGAVIETVTGDELMGCKILEVDLWGTLQALSAGGQDYTIAAFIGPTLLDAADVFPGTLYGSNVWWDWHNYVHRGTSHNVLAATSEFDVKGIRLHTRGTRRLARTGMTLWIAEETVGQNQSAGWQALIRFTR